MPAKAQESVSRFAATASMTPVCGLVRNDKRRLESRAGERRKIMKKMLEVCVDSLESALAAAAGGAMRLELCANLVIGGTTPAVSLLKAVKAETGLPVHALLRPRFGDFFYTDREFTLMLEDAKALLSAGADGLVSGCLTAGGDLDIPKMEALVGLAHGNRRRFTLHRAFDMCRDALATLDACEKLGVDTILTSGQKDNCRSGGALLGALHERARNVEILIGGGVDAAVIRELRKAIPGANQFHMSGKTNLDSPMEYRREDVHMGLPGLSEYTIYRTDPGKVRLALQALEEPV